MSQKNSDRLVLPDGKRNPNELFEVKYGDQYEVVEVAKLGYGIAVCDWINGDQNMPVVRCITPFLYPERSQAQLAVELLTSGMWDDSFKPATTELFRRLRDDVVRFSQDSDGWPARDGKLIEYSAEIFYAFMHFRAWKKKNPMK